MKESENLGLLAPGGGLKVGAASEAQPRLGALKRERKGDTMNIPRLTIFRFLLADFVYPLRSLHKKGFPKVSTS
jgi:hypothetical protein